MILEYTILVFFVASGSGLNQEKAYWDGIVAIAHRFAKHPLHPGNIVSRI
jgi:hypothetical protein